MTPTELSLTAIHKGPTARLVDISKQYLGLAPVQANRRASLNDLPFPTFKLNESAKAPYMVKVTDLAKYIDDQSGKATNEWTKSQVEVA